MTGPGYWMYETSGVLRPAIKDGDWSRDAQVAALRADIDKLISREAIGRWLDYAMDIGIDPL